MGLAERKLLFTDAEYLAWEALQPERHEFIRGEVYAMASAEDRHVTATGNAYMALRQHLAGGPCRTYMTDMRLHVAASQSYFYPDVLVTCCERDVRSPLSKSEPLFVVEVLSPSTAAFDRGGKFSHYRLLPSLQEYSLIDLDARTVDVYRKGADGLWVLHPFGREEGAHWASVGLSLSSAQLFAEIQEPAPAAEDSQK
jgi:Uma2 family endonuclease